MSIPQTSAEQQSSKAKAQFHHNPSIIFDILDVLFVYKKNDSLLFKGATTLYHELGGSHNVYQPIPQGIDILNKCHRFLKQIPNTKNLFILSNIGNASFEVMKKTYPDIFNLFDGFVTSGLTGYQKPDPRIYQHLLDTYQLDPQSCIFIDDKTDNVLAAQNLGMNGIVCDTHDKVIAQLEKYGIKSK